MTATEPSIANQFSAPVRSDPAGAAALSIAGVSHSYGARRALIDVAALKVIKTIQVGELPWGITMAPP